MAVRPSWEGHLRLSLVTCPVALYPATTEADTVRFHLINPETNNPDEDSRCRHRVEWLAELEDDSLLTKADIGEILRDELNRVPLRAHICERAGFVYCFLRGGGGTWGIAPGRPSCTDGHRAISLPQCRAGLRRIIPRPNVIFGTFSTSFFLHSWATWL